MAYVNKKIEYLESGQYYLQCFDLLECENGPIDYQCTLKSSLSKFVLTANIITSFYVLYKLHSFQSLTQNNCTHFSIYCNSDNGNQYYLLYFIHTICAGATELLSISTERLRNLQFHANFPLFHLIPIKRFNPPKATIYHTALISLSLLRSPTLGTSLYRLQISVELPVARRRALSDAMCPPTTAAVSTLMGYWCSTRTVTVNYAN